MNLKIGRIAMCALLVCLRTAGQSAGDREALSALPDSIGRLADTYLQKLTELKQFNGVVLLKKDGEVLLRKAYNMPGDTAPTLHVTPASRFDLRSVAKLFAKASVLQLEQEGLLSRRDTIGKYLPGFPNGGRITLQHLLDHASGLPREFNDSIANTLELEPDQVVALAGREPLEFEPGSREQYSNVGYQLLYYIIGMRCGASFSSCLKERFFIPLGMSGSGGNFDGDPGGMDLYAYGHYLDGDRDLQVVASFPPEDMRMGNIHSTVEDLDAFLSALNAPLYDPLVREQKISHAGGTRGKRAYVERDFGRGHTIVFLANYDAIPFERLVEDLGKILSGEPVKMPSRVQREPAHVPAEVLREYVGTYDLVDAGHLLLTIKLERDSLWVYQKGENNGVLYPESGTVFFGDPASEESLEFVKDGSGEYYILLDFQGVRWKGVRIED